MNITIVNKDTEETMNFTVVNSTEYAITCGSCSDGNAGNYCEECEKWYCGECHLMNHACFENSEEEEEEESKQQIHCDACDDSEIDIHNDYCEKCEKWFCLECGFMKHACTD